MNFVPKRIIGIAVTGAMIVAAAPTIAAALKKQQSPAPAPAAAGKLTADQVAKQGADLAGSVGRELAGRPGFVSAEDIEAVIVFAASQASAPDDVLSVALDDLTSGAGANELKAIANVRASMKKKTRRNGTGAIFGRGGAVGGGFSSSFSTPAISVGGGSSNYGG